jgi:hypothetical protein
MIKTRYIILLLIFGNTVYAQKGGCKVIKSEISGTYEGGCKNGLAHGKGIAQGIDSYEGQFKKGEPDGKGSYKWADGKLYDGQWKNGLREGEGKMIYKDSVVNGIWKEDKYIGKKLIPPYKIITSISVSRSTIVKSSDNNNRVKIRIMQGGADNFSIEDYSLAYDSGSELKEGNYYCIENVRFPLSVKVKYRTWNKLMTAQYNVTFEFVINQSGGWDVVINN